MKSVNEELKADVAYIIEHSPLPKWTIAVIEEIAYDRGHAYGEDEVNGYIMDWMSRFEEAYKKSNE